MCPRCIKARFEVKMFDLDELKHWLHAEWSNLNHAVVAAAIRQWRRLSACVKAGGGHFEQLVSNTMFEMSTAGFNTS